MFMTQTTFGGKYHEVTGRHLHKAEAGSIQ